MPSYNKYHKITLQITDENINILDKINQVKINNQIHLIYYGVLSHSPKTCPHCNQNSPCLIRKNGHRRVKIKMPFISDKPVILFLDKQRGCIINPGHGKNHAPDLLYSQSKT